MLQQQQFNMIVCEFVNDVIVIENKCKSFNESTTHKEIISFLQNENLYKYEAFNNQKIFVYNEELAFDLMLYARAKISDNLCKLFNVELNIFEEIMYEELETCHFEIMFNDYYNFKKHF